eukprot:gene14222-582_t
MLGVGRRRKNEAPSWQSTWDKKCLEKCCQSPFCANIKCAQCMQSIVHPRGRREGPPLARHSCLECLNDEIEIDYCEDCFATAGPEHWHTDGWLLISPDGTHTKLSPRIGSRQPSEELTRESSKIYRQATTSLEEEKCCLCEKTFELEVDVVQLRCRHWYHQDCLGSKSGDDCEGCQQSMIFLNCENDGRSLTFAIRPGETIAAVKKKIADEDGCDVAALRISHDGEDLEDSWDVSAVLPANNPFLLHVSPCE